jgi:DDE domain
MSLDRGVEVDHSTIFARQRRRPADRLDASLRGSAIGSARDHRPARAPRDSHQAEACSRSGHQSHPQGTKPTNDRPPLRWIQAYAAELEKRIRPLRTSIGFWRVDETYVKVKGRWIYLYRAVDSVARR